jgi:hypothetical protein
VKLLAEATVASHRPFAVYGAVPGTGYEVSAALTKLAVFGRLISVRPTIFVPSRRR